MAVLTDKHQMVAQPNIALDQFARFFFDPHPTSRENRTGAFADATPSPPYPTTS